MTFKTPYPRYDVLSKWESPSFNARTRAVVRERVHLVPERRFFTRSEWALMEAITARLVPQPDRAEPIPITPWIDQRLQDGQGEGFRHDGMPRIEEAWRWGLAGIEAEAKRRYVRSFVDLPPELQDTTLKAVQAGEVDEALFAGLAVKLFFSDTLLKTVVGIYYAHPAAWSEIGFGGPASPRGYVRMGFDERDSWEAEFALEG